MGLEKYLRRMDFFKHVIKKQGYELFLGMTCVGYAGFKQKKKKKIGSWVVCICSWTRLNFDRPCNYSRQNY